jgi:hypothetical protein
MNTNENKDLLVPYMVYQAINEKFIKEVDKARNKKAKNIIQTTHLVILGDFVEKYLGFKSETFLDGVRQEIAEKSGKSSNEVHVAELNLYYYKLGMIFWNSIPLLRKAEMVD